MGRPTAVTASAIVAIIGSIVMLLIAALAFVGTVMPPSGLPPSQSSSIAATGVFGATFFAALGILGIWTAVGLFRLRPWARLSMLVFAGVTTAMCLLTLIITAVIPMPLPPEADPAMGPAIRRTMMAMFGIPLAIGVWWLIQFNTQATKAAFASPVPAGETSPPARPLSISIIAWLSVVGGASCLFPILARMPLFLFGATFRGWVAGVIYAFFGAASLYIGQGLLRLRERARVLAIAFFGLSLAHVALITLVPPLRQRMIAMQREFEGAQPNPVSFDDATLAALSNVSLLVVALVTIALIWFLIRNRHAFSKQVEE